MKSMHSILFLSYINRSGSTYLANMLAMHPKVCVTPEAEILIDLLLSKPNKKLLKRDLIHIEYKLINNKKFNNWEIRARKVKDIIRKSKGKTAFKLFYKILTEYCHKNNVNSKIFIFKGTKLLLYYARYLSFFEQHNVKLLYLYRDGRATYASQKRSLGSINHKPMNRNVVDSAIQWKYYAKLSNRLINIITIKYEDLLLDSNRCISSIFANLNLKTENIKLQYNPKQLLKIPEDQKHLHERINKAPDFSRINKWEKELKEIEIAAYELVAKRDLLKLGYKSAKKHSFNKYIYFIKEYTIRLFTIIVPKLYLNIKKFIKRIVYKTYYA